MLKDQIKELLDKGYPNLDHKLQPPEIKTHGHLSTNIAFLLSKEKRMAPIQIAEEVKKYLFENATKDLIEEIKIAAPGFINIWFTKTAIQNDFKTIARNKKFGQEKIGRGRTVIVEYSSPNIAKPMHVGHFRSTIIGDALANVHQFLGYKTIRWNYVGDWGVQFGKLSAAWKLWGDEKKLKAEPIKHLLDLYVRFSNETKTNPELEKAGQEAFRKLEAGDKELRKLWQKFRKESERDFEKMYKTLGVKFDETLGESFYEKDLRKIIEYLVQENIAVRSEGALIIPLEDLGLPPAMVQKSDGATLYLTRDIANIIYRIKKYHPAKIIYEIGNEQELHFKQLFAVAKSDFLKGFYKEHEIVRQTELVHVGHGLVLGEDGKKLSTRAGKTIFMEDVIAEAVEKTRKIIEDKNPGLSAKEKDRISKAVAVGALKYNDLSQNRLSNITFDWDKMLSFEGDSGPYLLYSYARLKSIVRKAGNAKFQKPNPKFLDSELELEIILKLERFPEVVQAVAKNYFPNELAGYLYDLSKSINHFYQVETVLRAEPEKRNARLTLISATALVLKTGLNLLGIETLEEM